MNATDFAHLRANLVDHHVAGLGVCSSRVLETLRTVPRECFVPARLRRIAYEDLRLPAALGQMLPRPSVVAVMLEALDLQTTDHVLEVGTSTGYVSALLSGLAEEVCSVEPQGPPAAAAAALLRHLGCANVTVRHGPAEGGWPEQAPFDAILVHGVAPRVSPALKGLLALGGRLVMALGADAEVAELVRVTRLPGDIWRVEDLADLAPSALTVGDLRQSLATSASYGDAGGLSCHGKE